MEISVIVVNSRANKRVYVQDKLHYNEARILNLALFMRDHRPTSTETLISDGNLSSLQEHATQINLIGKKLIELLPRGTEDHCRAANIRNGYLIIETASAAIKMKIDYERLNLLSQLRSQGFAFLMGIETKINPDLFRQQQERSDEIKKRPPLSDSAATSILTTASMAKNPRLKERLERIADLAKKGD